MEKTTRFGVSLDQELLKSFDRLIRKRGYTNRSEAIRDLIRNQLVETEWAETNKETMGVISLVYNHERRELANKLIDFQHHHYLAIVSALHVHLDHHNCLEVLIVKGKGKQIKKMADKLISTRGVKYGSLAPATTGKKLV